MNVIKDSVRKLFSKFRSLKTIFEAIVFRSQTDRWEKVAIGGRPPWDFRNEKIAGFIPSNSTVLDLGCGAQTLKEYLAPGCEYQPCDLVRSSPEVIVCDFNAGSYPKLKKKYTYVVCSGVLEYIRDHKRFLKECSSLGEMLLISYNTFRPGDSKLQRMTNHWINHFTRPGLEEIFEEVGLLAECLSVNENGEVIYRLIKK